MTLYTTDYLEYYLTLVGWIVNNGIWNILVASGVFALPFVVIVVQEWLRARAEGADEGNKGSARSASPSPTTRAGRTPIPRSTTRARWCRCGGSSCTPSRRRSRELRWQPSPVGPICVRSAWTWTPHA